MGPPKRKAPALNVPKRNEDPAERKRILNVLAQRRYRQRRREHVKKLEAASESPDQTAGVDPILGNETTTEDYGNLDSIDTATFQVLDEAYPPEVFQQAADTSFDPSFPILPDDLQLTTVDTTWDLPSLPSSPISSPGSSPTTFSSPTTSISADSYNFPLLELSILRGATSIASRLGILPLIWSLESTSPIAHPSNLLSSYEHLPLNLRPTAFQRRTPHHPIIDLLPWPSVRDKLLLVLSMPEELRPGIAAKPTALIDFVYDLEDSAEGVRIWGDDPCDDKSWEVGEKLFRGWWWAFDTEVVARSNRMRKERGASLLGRGGGAVIGELG